eukprot:GEMP01026765.1.p1 GENE.GEMP01026765.1~~GEMP01026765.1.p1  ORF type:complete len:522 (+),score=111.30 GEMP01026765.1:37-1602(+)
MTRQHDYLGLHEAASTPPFAHMIPAPLGFLRRRPNEIIAATESAAQATQVETRIPARTPSTNGTTPRRSSSTRQRTTLSVSASPRLFSTRSSHHVTTPKKRSPKLSSSTRQATPSVSDSTQPFSTRSSHHVTTPNKRSPKRSSSARQAVTPWIPAFARSFPTYSSHYVTTPNKRSPKRSSSTRQATTPSASSFAQPFSTSPTQVSTPDKSSPKLSSSTRQGAKPPISSVADFVRLFSTYSSHHVTTPRQRSPKRPFPWPAPYSKISSTRGSETIAAESISSTLSEDVSKIILYDGEYVHNDKQRNDDGDEALQLPISLTYALQKESTDGDELTEVWFPHDGRATFEENKSRFEVQLKEQLRNTEKKARSALEGLARESQRCKTNVELRYALDSIDVLTHENFELKKQIDFHVDTVIEAREESRVLEEQLRLMMESADDKARASRKAVRHLEDRLYVMDAQSAISTRCSSSSSMRNSSVSLLDEELYQAQNEFSPRIDDEVARRRKQAARNLRWRVLTMISD